MSKYIPHVPLPALVITKTRTLSEQKQPLHRTRDIHAKTLAACIRAFKLQTLLHLTISSQILNVNQTKLYKL